jgi:hypothetical protein
MNKEKIYSAIEKKVNEDYFTGRVTLREIFSEQVLLWVFVRYTKTGYRLDL